MLIFEAVFLDGRVQDINLTIKAGQWWTLLGPNGAGKSSLLSLAAGLERPSKGSVSLCDEVISAIDIARLSEIRCLASQFYRSEFKISVKETFRFFTQGNGIPALIERYLDVRCLLNKIVDSLSGGEKQRVHLARNLMQIWSSIEGGKALILLDEPLQQMDVNYQANALKLLTHLHQLGNTIVMSHHDINQTLQYSAQVCLLKDGKIFGADNKGVVMTLDNMQALYAHRFKLIRDPHSNQAYFVSD